MVSTAGSRPNHYETLGLSPTAASDEIAQAFAREGNAFRPQMFGRLTEVCVAYETLRDPIKRRAYDASLGLKPAPDVGNSHAAPARPAPDWLPPPAPRVRPGLPSESSTERTVGSFIATSLRQPAKPIGQTSLATPAPEMERPPRPVADSPPGGDGPAHFSVEELMGAEVRPMEWKRAGVAAAALVVAAGLIGALAGWGPGGEGQESVQPKNVVSLSLPPADPQATTAVPPPALPIVEAKAAQPAPAVEVAVPEPAPALPPPAVAEVQAEESQSPPSEPGQDQVEPLASEQATADAPVSTVTASLPLPDRVIARTIERIGYACGSVASTAPVEGEAPGIFKVNCTSGQAYQARPVNGRYRFRRWGRQ